MNLEGNFDLDAVTSLMRVLSRHDDPEAMFQAYTKRVDVIIPTDRTVSLSRRDLSRPEYRITRSDLWTESINPWKERDRLPLLRSGLLGELIYAGVPRIIDDLVVDASDPAAPYFTGMGSLAAVPHFDNGECLNMVVMMRMGKGAFNHQQFPEGVLLSGLFGRAMKGLVLSSELREEKEKLQSQYRAVAALSETVRQQALALQSHADTLEVKVKRRTRQLEIARLDAIHMLAAASEEKDETTGEHLKRIQFLATGLARALSMPDAEMIGLAAILHDVGKMHVPDFILQKPGPLTEQERLLMQEHTIAGERILADRAFYVPARRVARSHHENWDGSGYPDHLAGDFIPLEARIVHLVDVYDALVSRRPYKNAWPHEQAIQHIKEQTGRMFDPAITETFLKANPAEILQREAEAVQPHLDADSP